MTGGFLLVDKGGGWTSHDVVAKVRRIAGQKKVGHAGTLDPMATGLLVLALGRATRLLRFIQDLPKEYVARAQLGVATDTLDAEGAVLEREPMAIDAADLRSAMARFVGPIMQVPPMVSALKVGGKRLYELAREGKEVEREARPVHIYELELTDFAPSAYPEVAFRVVCSRGTYVRTLADDLAAGLGGRAHLTELRRTRIGALQVGDAHTIADLEAADELPVLAGADALVDLPAVVVTEEVARGVSHGAAFPAALLGPETPGSGPFRVLDGDGGLLAVYRADGKQARAEVVTA